MALFCADAPRELAEGAEGVRELAGGMWRAVRAGLLGSARAAYTRVADGTPGHRDVPQIQLERADVSTFQRELERARACVRLCIGLVIGLLLLALLPASPLMVSEGPSANCTNPRNT